MQIGSLTLQNNIILAPLAGISNLPFRLLAKEAGCGLVYSEMVSANGLVRQSKNTKQMLDSLPEEKPLSVQIFGSDPDVMAEAAKIVEANGADIIDLNFGCSVKKIIKTGSGAALMQKPDLCEAVLKNVRKAVRLPLTIKIRTGWDKSGEQALNLARIGEVCGIDGIAVHPRTATQGFAGDADWSIIAAVKRRVSIPVIGNGDIFSAEDAIKMQAETGCDAMMIGRKAIGCPWIFSQVLAQMRGEEIPLLSLEQRFAIIRRYLHRSVKYLGEYRACRMMRSRLSWFVKGLPHSSHFRKSITQISSESQAMDLIDDYQQSLVQEANDIKGFRYRVSGVRKG